MVSDSLNVVPPHLPRPVVWCVGRPWDLVSQTSETKSVAISFLKYLNGDPLSTAMTCLAPMVSHKALLAAMSRTPSLSHVTYAFMGILMLVLLVYTPKFLEIVAFLVILRLILSLEHIQMLG